MLIKISQDNPSLYPVKCLIYRGGKEDGGNKTVTSKLMI